MDVAPGSGAIGAGGATGASTVPDALTVGLNSALFISDVREVGAVMYGMLCSELGCEPARKKLVF